ncbi:hypothetical protein TNCV_4597361 [Trichonephila clavipes]|nr:hypothetical protein TNCV_4597361 [Trichonephila clavipes]
MATGSSLTHNYSRSQSKEFNHIQELYRTLCAEYSLRLHTSQKIFHTVIDMPMVLCDMSMVFCDPSTITVAAFVITSSDTDLRALSGRTVNDSVSSNILTIPFKAISDKYHLP